MNNNTFFSILAKLVSNVSVETISEYASSSKEEANIYKNVLTTAFSKKQRKKQLLSL